MKYLITLLALCGAVCKGNAQTRETYSRARILLNSNHTIAGLSRLGLATDHGVHKPGTFFISDFSASELAAAKRAGYNTDILIADVQKHYREQNNTQAKTTASSCWAPPAVTTPSHFRLGTYAGYFTYTEMLQMLDSMRILYPGLVSAKQPIDTFHTIEGRPIYWLRISNNPDVEDPLKPQMLTTAVHHAREPGSMSATIFYMWYLLENYATDPRVKAIVDNTELYFVPCLNPDGYLQNIATDPSGGGMWRKNKRNNLDGTEGVDLNRNYGLFWGYDDFGSSPSTSAQTYRGPNAFSEPETRAIKWFAENHEFLLNLNFHTYNNALIYPWGHEYSLLTPDSNTFINFGSYITKESNYRYGTCDQTLSYVSNGGSDDWMYGETATKNKIFAFTPEIGDDDDGFYAPYWQIIPDCKKNVSTNINTASLLLTAARLTPTDDKVLTAPSGHLHYQLRRLGIKDGGTYTVSVSSLDSRLTVATTPNSYTGLAQLQQVTDSFSYSIDAATPNGALLRYVYRTDNGLYSLYDTVSFYYGKKHNITRPSTATLTDWTNIGWSVCTDAFFSGPTSLKSSADCGKYPNDYISSITLNTPVDLTYATEAWLRFHSKWGIESKFDFAAVYASAEGTGVWTPLCGTYSRSGTTYQLPDEPIYDAQQPEWVMEHMNLNSFLGQKVYLRFEMNADAGANYEGWWIDDVEIRSVQDTPSYVANVMSTDATLSVWPNPTNGNLHIKTDGTPQGTPVTGWLQDITGRKVLNIHTGSSGTINTASIPAGVYLLHLQTDGVRLPVKKIVKTD